MRSAVLFLTIRSPSAEAPRGQRILGTSLSLAGALLFFWVATSGAGGNEPAMAIKDDSASIVEFVDFQCPACRALHENLREALQPFEAKIKVIRRHLPLPQHQHAAVAALAYCCAEQAGMAEPMADRLFRATDLTASACEEIAVQVGVDRSTFRECMASPLPQGQPVPSLLC